MYRGGNGGLECHRRSLANDPPGGQYLPPAPGGRGKQPGRRAPTWRQHLQQHWGGWRPEQSAPSLAAEELLLKEASMTL